MGPSFLSENELVWLFCDCLRCWSSVGKKYWRQNHGQELSLGRGCNHKGSIIHELMHALGFWHEQSRPDRNLYVEVLWENIQDGKLKDEFKLTVSLDKWDFWRNAALIRW